MPPKFKLIGAVVLLAPLLWCAQVAWDYFDYDSIPHLAIRTQLKLFGSAIYEFHSATGKWPAALDDLRQTSLPQQNRFWRETATTLVILWPKDFNPDPKNNAKALLLYTNVGLFNRLGRMWVCWGDLRLEHMPESNLRTLLRLRHNP